MNQYNQQQGNLLQALGLMSGLGSQKTFEPMLQQRQGLLGPLLGAGGAIGGGLLGGPLGGPAGAVAGGTAGSQLGRTVS
jgi:hypothetical protein